MKINTKATNKKWFDFEKGDIKARFEIRPFPLSLMRTEVDLTFTTLCSQFVYSLTAWEGIVDENDAPLECNEENKTILFNFDDDIREFVFGKMAEMRERIKSELKN
jgi:hypothetical protein